VWGNQIEAQGWQAWRRVASSEQTKIAPVRWCAVAELVQMDDVPAAVFMLKLAAHFIPAPLEVCP